MGLGSWWQRQKDELKQLQRETAVIQGLQILYDRKMSAAIENEISIDEEHIPWEDLKINTKLPVILKMQLAESRNCIDREAIDKRAIEKFWEQQRERNKGSGKTPRELLDEICPHQDFMDTLHD